MDKQPTDRIAATDDNVIIWATRPDPERPISHIWECFFDDARAIVHEVSIGVWGWLLIEAEQGGVVDMRSGYLTDRAAMDGFERYIKEYNRTVP